MALIIEDGSNVENANSYVSAADARTFATLRGIELSADDSVVEAQLILAMDYIEALRDDFKGFKTNERLNGSEYEEVAQSLQWPRCNVYIDDVLFDEHSIPAELKNAQSQLVIEQFNGIDIRPSNCGKFIIDERVGPLVTKYSEKNGTDVSLNLTAVEDFLNPLLNERSSISGLISVRI
jgi:hypothetical protein